ncbi:MAG: aldo/keto reductase [Coraliomargaritaceae bacterium]
MKNCPHRKTPLISAIHRRDFLKTLAVSGAALGVNGMTAQAEQSDALGKQLPLRPLGNTGESITMIGLGGYHIGLAEEKVAAATIESALEEGVRFFDTAEEYQKGESEKRYGRYLIPKYRDDIFLMTKSYSLNGRTTRKHLEESLRRLGTEQLDLWQIHSIQSIQDVDNRIRNGVIEELVKAKEEGKVRHIGFTGHSSPPAHKYLMEKYGDLFACSQMAINPIDVTAKESFVADVLPELQRHNSGVLAMKSLADGRFFDRKMWRNTVVWESDDPVVPNYLSITDCTNFALSLPVSTLIVGADNPKYLREKTKIAREHKKLTESDRTLLIDKVAAFAEAGKVEYYKAINKS